MKEKRYELIFSLTITLIGIILSVVGYLIHPMVELVLVIGLSFLIYGVVNTIKTIMQK